ncbi:hypothetical protein M9H77_15502 [Catharanthus roseus]|uniref:Uncharacterized protein n=1 Tax=Catharanthus roseus TaxID=4058 RepID=A0ACC0AXP6_CATRO|nr:hypothetical protein M9H77_15502 [Catharanthus roseus]
MDITSATTTTTTVKTPEAETETPTRIQPTTTKALSFSNGVLKRHTPLHHHHGFNNHHHQHHHHPAAAAVVTYKECLKNHAASLGGHAVDGCGEFMPSPSSTPTDPTSLKCAACGCHRNFHRREPEESLPHPNTTAALEYQPHHRHHPPPPPPPPPTAHRNSGGHSSPSSPSPPPISSSYYPSAPHMLLALSAGLSGPPQDGNLPTGTTSGGAGFSNTPNGRKRFRTKFSQDQKDRMLEFAERVGWKMQKRDEELIGEFCNEIGVDKGVLKVWMHNNKNTFGKRDQANITPSSSSNPGAAATNNGNGINFDTQYHHHNHQQQNHDNKMHSSDSISGHHVAAAATNGSSSSS